MVVKITRTGSDGMEMAREVRSATAIPIGAVAIPIEVAVAAAADATTRARS
jgi:hypothetical protein